MNRAQNGGCKPVLEIFKGQREGEIARDTGVVRHEAHRGNFIPEMAGSYSRSPVDGEVLRKAVKGSLGK